MTNEITIAMPFSDMERLAVSIAKSGMFGMKTPEQALTLMMISQAEGRHPALAARDYDVIQGRPAKKAEAMLRDFLSAGGKVEWHALSDQEAAATFSHAQGGSVRISWTLDRAAMAQLSGKDNWKKFPRQMLRSRCVSEGVRTVWPMATSGMYVPEEQTDAAPFTGTTIDAETPTQPRQTPTNPDTTPDPWAEQVKEHRAAAAPKYAELDEQDGRKWLVNLEMLLANATSQDEVVDISAHQTVGKATANAPDAVKARISELLAKAYGRFTEKEWIDADTGEIHIKGEEKMGAG